SLINFQLNHLFGNILIFFAMICWSTYSNIGKQVMKKHSPVETTGMAVIFGMFFFFVAALSEKFWILKSAYNNSFFWLSVIFLGSVITFFTFLIFFYSVNRIGATTSSIFINLVPIFGTWFSYIFLKEEIYWTFLIGLLLIIIGIILINFPVKQTKLNERSSE
ncbi:MAG: DMT family transporter, partial [Candidatus Heimdallarchaeota archaeon]|nr:DMT family transporter [Candidatus Heimdallarchaeota archaeon]